MTKSPACLSDRFPHALLDNDQELHHV